MSPSTPDPTPASHPTRAAVRALEGALTAADTEVSGTAIGPYKLLQKLGEGGFGVVWMAEQTEPLRRRVALKIIKLGMDTEEVIARFEVERHALALMDHPNIARVLDAGATAAGRPFFVMELVRGVPLTRYCDDNRLSADGRLRLFIAICQAVQHAHQKGVIHRDLKPSNILVTLHDGTPVPKIIDFGIAKATDRRLTDATLFTQFHAFLGTPAYTSPEQMEMSGLDIDTRSDIYSLGVLLYELLAGRPPFDPDALAQSGLDAMRRTIREIDPPRPSHRLGTLADAERTTVAERRGTDAAKLSSALRGDLDWIVMHCLEKDRTRRYDTAAALALDLQRHLVHEPVTARPPSTLYRAQKLFRRHRLAVSAAAAVAVSLVGGLIVSSTLFVREHAARGRAVAAEKSEILLRAQAETARASTAKNASRTSMAFAERLFAEGKNADALAHLVAAARIDPGNSAVAPRLLSALAHRNFLLPDGAPLRLPTPVRQANWSADGRHVLVLGEDDVVRVIDSVSWRLAREFRFERKLAPQGLAVPAGNAAVFAVCLEDNSILVCDAATGRPRLPAIRAGFEITPGRFAISPDGRWVAASGEPMARVWDTTSGAPGPPLPNGDRGNPRPVFSPDSHHLVIVADGSHRAQIVAVADGTPVGRLMAMRNAASAWLQAVTFSRDGRLVALCRQTGIQICAAVSGEELGSVLPHLFGTWVSSARFSDDNRWLVVADSDWTATIWDLASGQPAFPPFRHDKPVVEAVFSADRRLLFTATEGGSVHTWDLETGRLAAEPAPGKFLLSPSGRELLIFGPTGLAYRVAVARGAARPLELLHGPDYIASVLLQRTPAQLRWFARDRATLVDLAAGRRVGSFPFPARLMPSPTVGPAENLPPPPAAMRDNLLLARLSTRQRQVWRFDDRGVNRVTDLPRHAEGELLLARFDSSGEVAAVQLRGPRARFVELRSLATGELVGPPIETDSSILGYAMKFSRNGRNLATIGVDGVVTICTVTPDHRASGVQRLGTGKFRGAVEFTGDSQRLIAVTLTGEVQVWEVATRQLLRTITGDYGQLDNFSADGRFFATHMPDGTARVWDAHTVEPAGEPLAHPGKLQGAVFSADGARLATGCADQTVRIWETRSGQLISEPLLSPGLNAVVFSPDGKFLHTTGPNYNLGLAAMAAGSDRIWGVPPALAVPAPDWLLRLATMIAGKRIDALGRLIDASGEIAQLDDLRRELAALPHNSPYVEWGRWIVADPATRSIAPGFTVTKAGAEKLAVSLAQTAAAP